MYILSDPRVKRLQQELIGTYHQAHDSWINMVSSKFGHALQKGLSENQWNDQCAAALLWTSKPTFCITCI